MFGQKGGKGGDEGDGVMMVQSPPLAYVSGARLLTAIGPPAARRTMLPTASTNDPEKYLSYGNPEFEHLICVICEGVYVDPQQCSSEHYFCNRCITDWLSRSHTCPIDRRPLTLRDLRPAPRILCNMIDSLRIRCRYHDFGCTMDLSGEQALVRHVHHCDHRRSPLRDHDYMAYAAGNKAGKRLVQTSMLREKGAQSVAAGDGRLFVRPKFDPRSCFRSKQ